MRLFLVAVLAALFGNFVTMPAAYAHNFWQDQAGADTEKTEELKVKLSPEAVALQQQSAVRKIIPNYRVSQVQARKAQDVFQRLMQDARAAQEEGNTEASLKLLTRALGYVTDLGPKANSALLQVKYQELKLKTPSLEWRRVEHKLIDLARLVEGYPLWDALQLERALSEAELRLAYQPQDYQMVETLGLLKEEMRLITETMGERFTADLRVRYREFLYDLEDKLGL